MIFFIYNDIMGLAKLADNCPPKIQNCPQKNRKKKNFPPNFEIVRQKNGPCIKIKHRIIL
jgi:hypothetical protein